MSRVKLEKLLEYVVNGDKTKASDLIHDVFVEKARAIYAKKLNEDYAFDEDEDDIDMSDDFTDGSEYDLDEMDSELDTEEMSESDDDDMSDDSHMMPDGEMMGDDEMMDTDPMSDDAMADPADAIMNVEDAIAELRAVFDEMMGETDGDETDDMSDDFDDSEYDYDASDDDMDSDEEFEFGADEMDDEDPMAESIVLAKVATPSNTSDRVASTVKPIKGDAQRKAPTYPRSEEKGSSTPTVKNMSTRKPQDHATKLQTAKPAKSKDTATGKSLM